MNTTFTKNDNVTEMSNSFDHVDLSEMPASSIDEENQSSVLSSKLIGMDGSNPVGLTDEEAQESLAKHGFNEVVINEQPIILQILSRYLGIVPLFITTTAVLSAAIWSDCTQDPNFDDCECNNLNDWASFVLLFIELNLVVYADFMGSKSSGDAMKQLQAASASKVGVRRNNEWVQLPTRELVPGDLVAVTIGMTIPADGIVVHDGEPLKLDYSSLTGEPLPEKKGKGASVLSGAVVLVGEGEMIVTKTGATSSLGTTQALIADAKAEKEKGGELANLLSKVAMFLCVYGLLAALIIGVYTGVNFDGSSLAESFKLAFVVLSAILPVTMPLVLTTTLAVGSQELAKDDALVQRFSAIPEMAGMDILCSDKTGTLTLGEMTVIKEECVVFQKDKYTVDDMMELALVCSRIEHSDAIDKAVTKFFEDPATVLADYELSKFVPFDPATKKVTAVATKKSTGQELCVVKGAPPVLMSFSGVDKGTYKKAKKALDEKSARGFKTLGVCIQLEEDSWELVGFLSILDPPRSDTAHTVSKCSELGVEVKMITGDQKLIAIEVARQLGLPNGLFFDKEVFHPNSLAANRAGGFANLCEKAGGFASVSPEHKHRVVTSLQQKGHVVGMTGDGVNDAPALSIADVGIAVAGATDAARGASDIVLQQEGLSTIVNALYGSRTIFKRIETYLTYRMCSSFVFGFVFVLIYCASSYSFPTWTLILISILNDFAVSSSSKDNVMIQRTPQRLNIWKVGAVAASMAIVSSLQTWGFMHSIVDYDGSEPHFWGIRPLDDISENKNFTGCEAAAFNFLVLIITLQFDLIAARSPKPFFLFSTEKVDGHFVGIPPPSKFVIAALSFSLGIATLIAVYWEDNWVIGSGYGMSGIGWRNAGLVWAWALLWFVITDLVKSFVVALFEKIEKDSSHGKPWGAFFQNTLTQEWDQDRAGEKKKLAIESLRGHLAEYDASAKSSRAGSDLFSIAVASSLQLQDQTALEEEEEAMVPLTHQDELLAVQTLQDDEALLRIISNMAHTINALQQQVDELSAAKEKGAGTQVEV
ncbi:Plasma membrane ATPase 2 (Fragment) [Seminavis robusta]|uniref:Plasma membrane ATPase n=1 Tax=Seminavis robusta TaxID=568900 RepID=A0A9N8DJJ0_9STRA